MFSALASPSGLATRGRSLVGALLLVSTLPAFAVRAWSSAYADALGDGIAARLIALVPTPMRALDEGLGEEDDEGAFADASDLRGAALDARRPRQPSRARAVPPGAVRISSAQILALAARGAMPRGVFVKANAQHPAGLLLRGVSALGVGLQDGDVLTEAAGQKASSVAVVVGIVLAARARQAKEISGRFYRGSAPFVLTVEQPYPAEPVPG